MKCYYTLFSKNGIKYNIGSYIILFIILLFIISIIFFCKCGYHFLEEKINELFGLEKERHLKYYNIKEIDIYNKENKIKKANKNKKLKTSKRKKNKNEKIINNGSNPKSVSKIELKEIKNPINLKAKIKSNKNNLQKGYELKNLIIYKDYELNNFVYINALKFDKRTLFSYYISLIKINHPIIFSFCPINDYNSVIIKIDLFFLSFCIFYFFNALFFNEKEIHKIYKDKGTYNFIYLVPYILYSFIISNILIIIIRYFLLLERNIIEIKKEKEIKKANSLFPRLKKFILIKYISFFISGMIFLLFLWYYLSSFCAVFQNTQIYLIKNALISFGFSLLFPFIINLLPCIFRIYSLKGKERKCFYNFSKIIQYI